MKIKIPKKWMGAKGRFVLQYQWWRGPIIIRKGPSRQQWILWLDNTPYVSDSDPASGSATLTKASFDDKWRDKGRSAADEVPPQTDLNPTKATPSWVRIVDEGTYEIIDEEPLFKKIRFNGNLLKGLWIMTREDPRTEIWVLERTETVTLSFTSRRVYSEGHVDSHSGG